MGIAPALFCKAENEIGTKGKTIYPDFNLAFAHQPQEDFNLPAEAATRLYLVFVQQGTGILNIAGSREIFTSPSLFCFHPQDCVMLEQSRDLKAQSLYFFPGIVNSEFDMHNIYQPRNFTGTSFQDLHLLEPFIDRNESYHGQLPLNGLSVQRFLSLFQAVEKQLDNQPDWYWPCRSRSYLLETLFSLYHLYNTPKQFDTELRQLRYVSEEIDQLMLYLHSHYHEKLSLSSLSRQFHSNRTTLEAQFQKATGMPIMSYLNQLRLRIAASMLYDTTIPITEVAERVGFGDTSHFGRSFRNNFGHSPLEYRKMYCWVLT